MQTTATATSAVSAPRRSLPARMIRSVKEFLYRFREFFYQLLRVDWIRFWVALIRYVILVHILRRLRSIEPNTGDIGVNTVHHNLRGLHKILGLSVPRSNLLLYPLAAIRMSKATPILSIGPRSEGELLNFMGMGFRNIRGLDLISYSPWVDLGDMHATPYKDDSFGAVIMGWCLAYSDNRTKVAKEVARIVRKGGIVAIGVEWSKESMEDASKRLGYTMSDKDRMNSVADILKIFEPYVDRVFFSHDLPEHAVDKWQLLVHFSVKKP